MENELQTDNTLRVFVVEDSLFIRERLIAMLSATPGVTVVGNAATPTAAIVGILRARPNAVLLDVHLIGGTGIDVLRAVHPRLPGAIFIVLTNASLPVYRDAYLDAGASYFLDKSHDFDTVPGIVSALHNTRPLPQGEHA